MANFEAGNDLKKQIHLYLDNQLGEDEERILMDHLSHHPQSNELLQNERTFRDFIKNNVRRVPVTETLKDTILKKIQA
ncbi:MAG: hypothetical protein LW630_10460 [Saprospiraceae bacterium]|jgi:hypothetical protein|nr:hypothetical protein [Saprospiraceae bacterium]